MVPSSRRFIRAAPGIFRYALPLVDAVAREFAQLGALFEGLHVASGPTFPKRSRKMSYIVEQMRDVVDEIYSS